MVEDAFGTGHPLFYWREPSLSATISTRANLVLTFGLVGPIICFNILGRL